MIYVDSSVPAAILFRENGFESLIKVFKDSTSLPLSSLLIEAEVCAATRRENLDIEFAITHLKQIKIIFPHRSLNDEYARIFALGHCRGADAHHLATALYLDPTARHLTFFTRDKKQESLAHKLGFKTLP
mgnify:CR=1 FL=1